MSDGLVHNPEILVNTRESIAIIGTREPDENQAGAALHLAFAITFLGQRTVKTGAAYGIDQKAMEGTRGKNLEVYLPWASYNRDIIPREAHCVVYSPSVHTVWRDSVTMLHPGFARLSHGAISLHARNYGIVEGCKWVIAFPGTSGGGGTGQGIRVANYLGIPVIQANKGTIDDMPRFIGRTLQKMGLVDPNIAPIIAGRTL